MRRRLQIRQEILNHLSWFLVSLSLAFFVWLLATIEADPIEERRFVQINIQMELDPNLTIVSQSRSSVSVIVRARESAMALLTNEDITIRADLGDLGVGTHTVELETSATRRAVVDPQPRQIIVELDERQSIAVPAISYIVNDPPAGYEYGEPVFSEPEVIVNGAASLVQQVVAARVRLDLIEQRDTLVADLRLVPVNSEGVVISGVDLIPETVTVTVPVALRGDVQVVSVEPVINSDTLPEGYDVTSISYDPQTVIVVGSAEALASLPDSLRTERITLEGRTEDFDIVVPVILNNDELTLLGERSVTVSVGITVRGTTLTFDNIPVTVIGLDEDVLEATLVTNQVTVFVSGPQPILSALEAEDIGAVLDLNGLASGTHDVPLTVTTSEGEIESVSHPEITVTITELVAEATEEPAP
jgi:YbbR domain-containing protein